MHPEFEEPRPTGQTNGSVSQHYNDVSQRYDDKFDRYVTESVRGLLDRAGDAIANRGGADRLTHADVLDVGTGTGVVVRRLAERHPLWTFTGVDISDGMLDVAKAHLPRHTFVLAGAENLPFPNESFDVIVTLSSFHFWSDSERGLAEIRRVLRPGGLLVLSDWCHDFWACKLCAWYLWLTPGYSKADWDIMTSARADGLLRSSGFEVQSTNIYQIDAHLFMLPWMPRWGMMTFIATKDV